MSDQEYLDRAEESGDETYTCPVIIRWYRECRNMRWVWKNQKILRLILAVINGDTGHVFHKVEDNNALLRNSWVGNGAFVDLYSPTQSKGTKQNFKLVVNATPFHNNPLLLSQVTSIWARDVLNILADSKPPIQWLACWINNVTVCSETSDLSY